MLKLNTLLDSVNQPSDFRNLDLDDLTRLAAEVRQETIEAVSITGGHLGAGLGVVELTVALHYVFDTPRDRLIWDVSHQAYPHKILTGRRDRIRTLRQADGLYGFTKRSESEYDPFGAAHSSTAISAGLGMAMARDLGGDDRRVISVVGDGAMSAGLAYEGLNNAGGLGSGLVVVLNDNNMSIADAVGALTNYLVRLVSRDKYTSIPALRAALADRFPTVFERLSDRAGEILRDLDAGDTLFDQMGFEYVGPVDGHNLEHLIPVLQTVRDAKPDRPVLIHAVTEKGYGYAPAEQATDKYHGVGKYDVATGEQVKSVPKAPSYTGVFADALIREAEHDEKIVAISAGMPSGTGVDKFAKRFPERSFDVGIAEQHAVTFAAGLATEGYRPFCAIYSTFLQRGYDQIVHDVALQGLPVRFAIDRAGLVGADGPTHAGSFDIAYLGCLPNMVLMAAADEAELVHMVATAAAYDEGPIAFRYPRGEGCGVPMPNSGTTLPIGRGRVIREGGSVALLSFGARLGECLEAADRLAQRGCSATVADARFAKPLDEALIARLAAEHEALITIEEGAVGGFGSHVLQFLASNGLLDGHLKVRSMTLPDRFINHGSPAGMYEDAGLTAADIVETALAALGPAAARQWVAQMRAAPA